MREHLYSRLLSSRPLFVHFVRPITPQQLEWSRSLVDFSPPRIILFYFFFYKKTCRKTVIIIYVYLGPYSPPASAVATGAFFTEGGGHWSDLNRWSWAQTRAPIGGYRQFLWQHNTLTDLFPHILFFCWESPDMKNNWSVLELKICPIILPFVCTES